jgi:hypothetical protein
MLHHYKRLLQKTASLQKIGCLSSINQLNLVRKRFYSKKVTAAKGPPRRETQKEVKLSTPERVRKSVH